MKPAACLALLLLAGLCAGCGSYPANSAGTTNTAEVAEVSLEGGMIVSVKAVDLPSWTPAAREVAARPARKADPAAEMNGVFGGLIGGMSARAKAAEGKNGEELNILMDRTGGTIVVVQARSDPDLAAGDRVVVRDEGMGNISVVRAASRR